MSEFVVILVWSLPSQQKLVVLSDDKQRVVFGQDVLFDMRMADIMTPLQEGLADMVLKGSRMGK
jgi:hypothetical protein